MRKPSDPSPASFSIPEERIPAFGISDERLAALSPEERRRIGVAMRFLVDLKALYLDGMRIATDVLEGEAPASEVGMRLLDFERKLREAANDMPKRPLRVVHAKALRGRETRLDYDAWLMRVRIKASEARRAGEENAGADGPRTLAAAPDQGAEKDELETEIGPRP